MDKTPDGSLDELNKLTERIIGCAIEVHRTLGPGLLESTYESALCIELENVGIAYHRQFPYPIIYKGRDIGNYRIDLIVEDKVIVELKSVERFDPRV
jgi:GxxExxY protein